MKTDKTWKFSILFAIIYFVQGTGTPESGFAAQPLAYLLKEVMFLTAAQSAYFLGIMSIAWNIKPLYGLVSDFFPIFGYRRKSYLLLVNFLSFSCWLTFSFLGEYSYLPVLAILMACSLGLAFSDVVCDGFMVQTGKPLGKTGDFQSIQWAAISIASILAGIGGGWIAENMVYKDVFFYSSIFPLLTMIATLIIIDEEKTKPSREQIGKTWQSIKNACFDKTLWSAAFFIFFWNFSPSFGIPFFYYERDVLGFSKIFIGVLDSLLAGAGVIGAIIYKKYCKPIPLKKLLRFTVVFGVVSTLAYLLVVPPFASYLPIQPATFMILTTLVFGVLAMISLLALLELSALACPKLAESTVFATLMSVFNIGGFGSKILGGWLYDLTGMAPLIVISAVFTAFCWFLIKTLDEKKMEKESDS